jgi:hypothetical protein
MDRRAILRTVANGGIISWIAPKLRSLSIPLGEVDGSTPRVSGGGTDPAKQAPIYARGAANWGVWVDWYICPWFPDKDRTGFDAADWIRRLKEAGFDYVIIESRYISGLWLFPPLDPMWHSGTTYEKESSPDGMWPRAGKIEGVSRDYMSELAREAKRQGLRLMISVWVTDASLSLTHPDWIVTDAKGEPRKELMCTGPSFASPFADYILNELRGILSRSPNIEAVVFDGLMEWVVWGVISWDRYTREAFEKRFGKPMETGSEAELWQLQEEIYGAFFDKVREVFKSTVPDAQLVTTNTGPYLFLPPGPRRDITERLADKLHDDFYEEGHELSHESSCCKLYRNAGRPYELTSPADLFWSEYFFRPWPRVALEAAIIFSQGGNFSTTVRPFQNGVLAKGETDNLTKAGQWVKKRKPFFVNTESVADAAIWIGPMLEARDGVQPLEPPEGLWPGLSQFLKLPEDAGIDGGMIYNPHVPNLRKPGNGLENALLEHHIPFDLLPPKGEFDKYQLVVLQDGVCMDYGVAERLRHFVKNGGTLLAEGHASLLDERGDKHADFVLADVLGLNFKGYSPHVDANYLTVSEPSVATDLPDYPLNVEGGAILVKTTTARVLGRLVYPAANRMEYRTLEAHNCPGETTPHPAITSNRFGKGEAVYVAAALGRHILLRGDMEPWTKQLAANLVRHLVSRPLYRTDAPAGVEVVFNRQGGRYIVHFLNYYSAMDYAPSTAKPLTLGRFGFEVSALRIPKIERAFFAPDAATVPFGRNGDWWTFPVGEPDPIDTILVIEPSRGS